MTFSRSINSSAGETPKEVRQVFGTIAGEIKKDTLGDGVWSTEDRQKVAKLLSELKELDQNDRLIVTELAAALQQGHTPEGNQALLDVANKYGRSPVSRGVEVLMLTALMAMERSNRVDPQMPGAETYGKPVSVHRLH